MNIFGFNIGRKGMPPQEEQRVEEMAEDTMTTSDQRLFQPTAEAGWGDYSGGQRSPIVRILYSGEKDFGNLGPALKHIIDHNVLGQRAWQMDLESETSHTITKQKGKWTLGTGLRLQCEPQVEVLRMFGIDLDNTAMEQFNKTVEALWKVYAYKSTMADYAGRVSLHKIAKRIDKNKGTWGDILIVHRIDKNNNVTTQLIDGQHVGTPIGLATIGISDKLVDNQLGYDYVWTNGNRIRNGVEISDTGEHIAYHVRTGLGYTYTRIAAKNSMGMLMCYLVYGSEFRLDNTRGIPDITPNMESAKQLDEYTTATVGSAVERQRIAYYIKHDKGTEGTDPRSTNLAKIVGTAGNLDLPKDVHGEQMANTISISSQKQTYNMRPGSELASLESKQELHYKEFRDALFYAQCASVGIPPEVASQLYGSSYSASRAATNGWQYMLNIDRDDFGDQFYQRVKNLQLLVWVLAGMIKAPGYLDAFYSGNQMVLAAYNFSNWDGDPVPQIDEYKEVMAARLKLGVDAANVPMSTFEKVVRDLGDGSFDANLVQYARELEDARKLNIEKVLPKGSSLEGKEPADEGTTTTTDKKKKKDK